MPGPAFRQEFCGAFVAAGGVEPHPTRANMAATQGLKMLEAAGVEVTHHPYVYDPNADAVGLAAAMKRV